MLLTETGTAVAARPTTMAVGCHKDGTLAAWMCRLRERISPQAHAAEPTLNLSSRNPGTLDSRWPELDQGRLDSLDFSLGDQPRGNSKPLALCPV